MTLALIGAEDKSCCWGHFLGFSGHKSDGFCAFVKVGVARNGIRSEPGSAPRLLLHRADNLKTEKG